LIVAVPAANKVVAIDLDSGKISKSLDVPAAPQEVLISPDGGTAWVSCDKSGKIAQIDTSSWTVSRLIDAGKTVDGLAWVQ
jgi:DNA-binding beta-propeller fold protein YncE